MRPGSTRARTLVDPDGAGVLEPGPGLPLIDRTELAPAAAGERVLATLAQVSDVHVRDAQSPARVAFLDRLGPRLGGAFRPHEVLTTQVLAATVASVNAARPDAVLVTGDLVDSAQRNELAWALTLLRGGTIRPDSGARGYEGVQAEDDPDPFYYRPDADAPRHPGLLRRALEPVRSEGLRAPWHPVLGNHDTLVQGELPPTDATRAAATGSDLLVTPDPSLLRRLGRRLTRAQIDALLRAGLPGDRIRVAPDPDRTQLAAEQVVRRLAAAGARTGAASTAPRLDHAFAVGDHLWVIALDLVRRDGGSGGVVVPDTVTFLADALDRAGDRAVLVCCHQPLHGAAGADAAFALLDPDPRVVAVLAGHTHRNAIEPRRTSAGGLWLVTTASVVDWPQQWRTVRLVATRGGRLALETWLVDHTGRPGYEGDLAGIARDLAYLDPQGGRPQHAAGPRGARNVRLHLPRRALRAPRTRPPIESPPAPPEVTFGAGDTPT